MKALYIVGFMGSGKTTVGAELAKRLNVPVVDTDHYIEQQAGRTITDIFAEEGEEKFRLFETAVLEQLPTNNIIITTGGGLFMKEVNRQWMKANGTVIYLHCDLEEIWARLQNDHTRPLLQHQSFEKAKELYEWRQPFYAQADIIIDTTGKQIAHICNEILSLIKDEAPRI
jgi:shikimate kinase